MKPLGQPIAAGHIAEVYAWEGKTILKLFRPDFPREWAEYEAGIARQVEQAGGVVCQQWGKWSRSTGAEVLSTNGLTVPPWRR